MAVDTNQSDDAALSQLRKLREGPGLTAARLEQASAVMSSLGTSDPQMAYERLLQIIGTLDDTERARALQVDFGLQLDELLDREPAGRERERLGERRSGYAGVVQRDVKTLSRWSDRAVAELRALLLNDTFRGNLYVVAAVRGDRILGSSLIQEPVEVPADGIVKRDVLEIENPSDQPSMPCLIYMYPRDWEPATLTLVVAFRATPYPEHIWGTYSDNILKLPHGVERYLLTLEDGTARCKFVRPRRGLVYGVWWSIGR